jgi:hypothetical protein
MEKWSKIWKFIFFNFCHLALVTREEGGGRTGPGRRGWAGERGLVSHREPVGVGGLCSWFGRFGAFGHDIGICRAWAGGSSMVMAFGCVRRGGSCVRPLSKCLVFVAIKGGDPSPLIDKNLNKFFDKGLALHRGGGGISPPLRTSTTTKHATTPSLLALPPPSPPFLLSFLSRMYSLGLLCPHHVVLPRQHPSTTTIPVRVPHHCDFLGTARDATARDARSITGRGFQIVLSREVSWEKSTPSFRRLKSRFSFVFISDFKRRNEGEGAFHEASRQNNLESPPRD